jgi:hypothetical protein
MKLDHQPNAELQPLLTALFDGRMTATEESQLADLLRDDADARHVYWDYCSTHALLRYELGGFRDLPTAAKSLLSSELATASVPNAGGPVSLLHPFPAVLDSSVHSSGTHFSAGWPVAYLIATVIFAVGLAVGAVVHVTQPVQYVGPPGSVRPSSPESPILNPSPIIGRVTGMVDCVLNNDECRMLNDELRTKRIDIQHCLIHLGDCLALKSGLLEITYDTGAKVILQGPVTYVVESPAGGYLSVGKLTAKLEQRSEVGGQRSESASQKSEIRNQIFAVRTPTALVTDLGTEFGVEVDKNGATQSHVFRGSVRIERLSADRTDTGSSQVLHANESARVTDNPREKIVVERRVNPTLFIRAIPKSVVKSLDLVDVVAGGDGFSGRRNAGIDPTRGELTKESPKYDKDFLLKGDGRYHRVTQSLFVDGVFIPDGSHGAVQVDSAGHTALAGVNTSNETSGYVWAGGQVPMSVDFPRTFPTRVGEVDYTSDGHGLIFLHANKGITFDLDAIRRKNGDSIIRTFRAVLANSETISPTGNDPTVFADAWVLVDGQTRFRRRQITSCSGLFRVTIPLGKRDRFLTLVATDAGNGISNDWIMFGDPQLEMVERQSERQ